MKNKRQLFNNKEKSKKDKTIKLSYDLGKKGTSSIIKLNNNKNNNFSYIIRKHETSNDVFDDKKSSADEDSKILPNLYFYDFLFNNIYLHFY